MNVKITLKDNNVSFVYDNVTSIGKFLGVLQIMVSDESEYKKKSGSNTIIIAIATIESIKVYLIDK